MSLQPFAAWVLVAAAGVFAAVFAVSHARKVLRRRARRLHYLRLAHDKDGALILRAPVTPAIAPERVASISTDAQQAALRVAQQVEPQASNPHPARTREFVLWEATFHSALSDFTELAEHMPPASNSAPTP
jgi:predicted kinase